MTQNTSVISPTKVNYENTALWAIVIQFTVINAEGPTLILAAGLFVLLAIIYIKNKVQ